jgi:subtilisin family serine protease
MREYNVILKKGVDYDEFWNDIESDTDGGKLYIPNRKVEFTNERTASLRQCWYLLTDEEAEQLKLDERVFDVEIPPEHRTDVIIAPKLTQYGDFTKTSADAGSYINWGLMRSNSSTNNYGSGTTIKGEYNYTLTGAGVDVVIQDSGIQVDHPEFQDEFGNSRVQQINWATESGLSFTQNANHYRDFDGHGTHCAGIAAGKTYGWARNARIYAVKLSGLEGSGDSGTGISTTYAFDCIKVWHNNKPIDPKTGAKRPTVVNMSWGYLDLYNTVSSLTYRGTTYSDGSTTGNASYRSSNYGLLNVSGAGYGYNYMCNVRLSSVDTDIQEMIDAGIVVCIAAGNRSFKIDTSSGTDYNNYVATDQGNLYYHRGSSPYDDEALVVGSLDSTVYSSTEDQKATYSETGPGVSIYAPGTNIMSCTSNTNRWGGGSQNYYLNSSFRQTNISGTSMAAPQVAGVAALLLELNPKWTPAQVKTFLLNTAGTAIYSTGSDNDWSTNRSIKGGAAKVLANKFNSPVTFSASGIFMTGVSFKTR